MCTKVPPGQEPCMKDCFQCKPEDKKVTDDQGNCPHDLFREKYLDPTDE